VTRRRLVHDAHFVVSCLLCCVQVQQAANLKSMDPQMFCNQMSADFQVCMCVLCIYIAIMNGHLQ